MSEPNTSRTGTIRVASYNIRLGLEQGLPAVSQTLLDMNADIVALQEVGSSWHMGPDGALAKRLAQSAGYHHSIFAGALFQDGGSYGIALLARSPMVAYTKVWHPVRDDEQRVLLKVRLGPPLNLTVWNTHLSIREWDRTKQLESISKQVAADAPDVLVGDFNLEPEETLMASIPLRNAWLDKPTDTYPTKSPEQCLDSIFIGNAFSIRTACRAIPSHASDHLPIMAEIQR
ncbi:MAG: hypothetical protein CMH54_07170 [Myxococcales bacterium]|nr:hypothetical protein [Myxococcales bacterium]|tara:strand:+ start:316 stop:1008 length:693 start_codon:yes stop_codon:yes gene_type:complete